MICLSDSLQTWKTRLSICCPFSVSDGSAFSHNPLRLRAHNIKPYSWPSGVTVQCLSGGGDAEASCVHALVDIVNFLIRKPTPAPASR